MKNSCNVDFEDIQVARLFCYILSTSCGGTCPQNTAPRTTAFAFYLDLHRQGRSFPPLLELGTEKKVHNRTYFPMSVTDNYLVLQYPDQVLEYCCSLYDTRLISLTIYNT